MAAASQRLSDITRGLQHAAQTTLSMVAEQFIQTMQQFFDPLDDGTLKAKTVRVQVDENSYVLVPLVTLVSPRSLLLDRMRVNLSVRLESADVAPATSDWDNAPNLTRTSFRVATAPRGGSGEGRAGDTLDVELEFKAADAPESMMRVIDMFTNTVSPFTPPPGGKLDPMPYVQSKAFLDFKKQSRARAEEQPPPRSS